MWEHWAAVFLMDSSNFPSRDIIKVCTVKYLCIKPFNGIAASNPINTLTTLQLYVLGS